MTSVAGCECCEGSCCRQRHRCTSQAWHPTHNAGRDTKQDLHFYHALPSSARAARTPLPCADLGEPLSLPEDKRPPSLPADGAELMGRGGTIAAAQGVTNEAQGTTTEEMWEWI
jgi:hypothetical protein